MTVFGFRNLPFLFAIVTILNGCATSTEQGEVGVRRRQLFLIPEEQVIAMSTQSYEQLKDDARKKNVLDRNPVQVQKVNVIANRLIPSTRVFRREAADWKWEIHVISSPDINAFCMPGGKIIFYTGILEKLQLSDGEIAAVMGHEIAHALRDHGRERMSEEMVKQLGLDLLTATGVLDPRYADIANQAAVLAVSLPHGRGQEYEADQVGLELMARSDFNPEEALSLWKKMANAGGAKMPTLLSTHPSDEDRMRKLSELMPKVLPLYRPKQR